MNRRTMNPLTAVLTYGSLLLGCVVVLLPLLIVFMASFKTDSEFYSTPMFSLPNNFFNLRNYQEAFSGGLMLQGFWNTTIIVVFSCIGTIIIGSMTAYVLERVEKAAWNQNQLGTNRGLFQHALKPLQFPL